MGRTLARQAVQGHPYLLLLGHRPEFVYLLARYARHGGYATQIAAHAEDALLLPEQVSPAAIFIDAAMPAQHAGPVLRRLQDDPRIGAVPRVLCGPPADVCSELAVLADMYLATPIIYHEFLRALTYLGIGGAG